MDELDEHVTLCECGRPLITVRRYRGAFGIVASSYSLNGHVCRFRLPVVTRL